MTYIHKHPDIYIKLHKHNKLNISDLKIYFIIHRLFIFENNTLNFHRYKAQITRDS
jgi:hypothetical protein